MGQRGPMPKRKAERAGHISKAQRADVDTVVIEGEVEPPPTPAALHPQARRWYRSLIASGQSQFYEPSDWELARYVALQMSLSLTSGNAALFRAVWMGAEALMATEPSRRRNRIEVNRRDPAAEEPDDAPDQLADLRERLRG